MKKVHVTWSTEALVDLETIYDFLAERSQSSAQNVVEKLLSRSRQIETFPESGVEQRELQRADRQYRYLVEGNYKIIYRVSGQHAYIAAVFDTRINPDKLKV